MKNQPQKGRRNARGPGIPFLRRLRLFAAKSSFQLVLAELMMFVGLVLLLSPAVSRARESARRSACMNNIRQIGLALKQYAVDHDDRLTEARSVSEILAKLGSYLTNGNVYACPSDPTPGSCSYCFVIPGPDETDASFPLVMEKGLSPTNTPLSALVGKSWSASPHGGGGNVYFSGGHVKWCTRFDESWSTNGWLLVPQ